MIIVYACFSLIFGLAVGQRPLLRASRYDPVSYFNLPGKPSTGVGVLQDLSNARILSNEPFIISFEFPKLLGKAGDSRKSRFGAKRGRALKKKNRKLRQFRQIVWPEGDLLERTKRFQTVRQANGVPNSSRVELFSSLNRSGKGLFPLSEDSLPMNKQDPLQPKINEAETPSKAISSSLSRLEKIISPEKSEDIDQALEINRHLESVKDKWNSFLSKRKEPEDNELIDEDEKFSAKSRKLWENSPLLKLLNARQRSPYFYKVIPPNYPSLLPSKEQQKECIKKYDILDLSRDKMILSDKIEQFEKLLTSDFRKADDESRQRNRRDVQEETKPDEENTLQDESLQGKSEGEVRSDRSKRTKMQPRRKPQSKADERKNIRREQRKRKIERKLSMKESDQTNNGSKEVRTGRKAGNLSEGIKNKILEDDLHSKTGEVEEKKREKQEIKTTKDSRQDVLSQNEVNKIIRQKELEANIFDKVVTAMKKYEETNPYEDSSQPQKRENGNETAPVVQPESIEDGFELEDAVKKLAKIFKILGVKADARKKSCAGCEVSEEDESENDSVRMSKSDKCNCSEECPLCQNCLKCFKECRKNSMAVKSALRSKQTASEDSKGFNSDKKYEVPKDGRVEEVISVTSLPQTEGTTNLYNNVRLERMYRSKLPPSRDHVRLYFDNPENKLLVWTKRGRRTMPWGPLTSDLQLYRDRAKQILKSAEDILQRIKETEEKIHSGHYDNETNVEKKEEDLESIIKKVVNEDSTKSVLQTPWKALGESNYETETNQIIKGKFEAVTQEAQMEREDEETTDMSDEHKVAAPEADSHLEAHDDDTTGLGSTGGEKNLYDSKKSQEIKSETIYPESIEAAVEEEKPRTEDKNEDIDALEKSVEMSFPSEEVIPAKVEAVNNIDLEHSEESSNEKVVKDKTQQVLKFESDETETEDDDSYKKAVSSENVTAEDSREAEDYSTYKFGSEQVAKSNEEDELYSDEFEKSEEGSFEDVQLKNQSQEKSLEELHSDSEFDEEIQNKNENEVESGEMEKESHEKPNYSTKVSSKFYELKDNEDENDNDKRLEENEGKNKGETNIFEDQIKPIEESYIIKGVKQTKEEKEAILKALQNVDGVTELPVEEEEEESDRSLTTEKLVTDVERVESADEESEAMKTLIEHLERGHMNKEDFDAVKKLDDSKIDRLVDEMQKKDDKGQPVNCETRMKLCQAACGCNGENPDMTKYDIIKGFLSWLKSLQMDQMVPIST